MNENDAVYEQQIRYKYAVACDEIEALKKAVAKYRKDSERATDYSSELMDQMVRLRIEIHQLKQKMYLVWFVFIGFGALSYVFH